MRSARGWDEPRLHVILLMIVVVVSSKVYRMSNLHKQGPCSLGSSKRTLSIISEPSSMQWRSNQ